MRVPRRVVLWVAILVVVLGAVILFANPLPSRGSAKAVKLSFSGPNDFLQRKASLDGNQIDEFFTLLGSSRRLWLQKKMIALGGAWVELDNGKTKAIFLLTVPGQYDAFQIEGSQFTIQPAGQIEKFLASLPPGTVRMMP